MDVLHISIDPTCNKPYFTERVDEEDLQVVILDNHVNGPYFDIWSLFSKHDVIRLDNLTTPIPPSTNIIIPLTGASNPI